MNRSLLEHLLIEYRWVLVIFFLLPLSLCYDCYSYFRTWIVFKLNSAPKSHDRKVKAVQHQVKEWIKNGREKEMCTARPGWQTVSFRVQKYKEKFHNVRVNLVDILDLDVNTMRVRVEPLVSMGQLTKTLEPLGWTIPVVPELDDLTVGGLVMGTGIETSSHIYGLFQDICLSYELVLANGEVIKCSKDENEDLFNCIPWSYGTFGFLTAVEIKIIPAKRFVRLEYYPLESLDEVSTLMKEKMTDGNEFVEGILYGKDKGVLLVGNMSTTAEPGKLNEIGKWYKPWFFKHAESYLNSCSKGVEYIPLREYYHRHSKSLFWEMEEIVPFGNNLIFRWILGWMVPPKVSLLKLSQPKAVKELYETKHMIQDMLVPLSKLQEAIELFHQEAKIYPIWLCPYKNPKSQGMLRESEEEMFIDIGVYGVPKSDKYETRTTTRKIESFVRRVKGYQMLYADTYMTKPEFREMFNHDLYDKLRKKYNCEGAFPEVYNKVSLQAREEGRMA